MLDALEALLEGGEHRGTPPSRRVAARRFGTQVWGAVATGAAA
jgi:hypothetical protein